MTLRLVLAVCALSAFGCVGPQYVWVKHAPQDELTRDRYECERDTRAAASSFGPGLTGQLNAEQFMGRCFQAKGYTLQPIGDGSRPWGGMPPPQSEYEACVRQCESDQATAACYTDCRVRHLDP